MSPGPPYQWDIEYGNIDHYEFGVGTPSTSHLFGDLLETGQ